MLKFHLVKATERGLSDSYDGEITFDSVSELEQYLCYHRAYIVSLVSLDGTGEEN